MEFQAETFQMIENDEVGISRTWDQVAHILVHAAKKVCGTHRKRVENPLIIGAENEREMMREEINKWITARNTARENGNNVVYLISMTKISRARKKMKKKLRSMERDWWNEKLQECSGTYRQRRQETSEPCRAF